MRRGNPLATDAARAGRVCPTHRLSLADMIAKMEKGAPSVSIDLLIKSLLALGTTRREIASTIA